MKDTKQLIDMGGLKLQRVIGTVLMYIINRSRRKVPVTSINNGNTGYYYVKTGGIKTKRSGQRFEGRRRGRPADRCLQHTPEKTKHRCSPENRSSNEGSQVVRGSEEQVVGGEPSFTICQVYCSRVSSSNSTGPRAT